MFALMSIGKGHRRWVIARFDDDIDWDRLSLYIVFLESEVLVFSDIFIGRAGIAEEFPCRTQNFSMLWETLGLCFWSFITSSL